MVCFHVAERFGVIFHDDHKKKKHGRSSSNSGYKIHKKCGGKIYSRRRTFGAEVHKSSIRVERWHNKYEILNIKIENSRLFFKRFAY